MVALEKLNNAEKAGCLSLSRSIDGSEEQWPGAANLHDILEDGEADVTGPVQDLEVLEKSAFTSDKSPILPRKLKSTVPGTSPSTP